MSDELTPTHAAQGAIVFLDRDGTINVDHGYVFSRDRLELCPDAAQAIAALKLAGYRVVIISNQSAVGRGWATVADVDDTNSYLQELLLRVDSAAVLDQVLYCTDAPEVASDRRKPGTGMISELRSDLPFVPERCWMIGDKLSDIEFGIRAGLPQAHCLLLAADGLVDANQLQFPDLAAAVQHLLASPAVPMNSRR